MRNVVLPSRYRRLPLAVALLAGLLAPAGVGTPAGAGPAERWQRTVPGGRFHWSSPVVADVNGDGRNDIVVGGLDGRVRAWDADGNTVPGWANGGVATASVASSPAVGDVDGDGRAEVVVGTGSLDVGDRGAINVFNGDGTRRCALEAATGKDGAAVTGTPALGDVTGDGINDIVFGAHDHLVRVVDGRCNLLASFDNRDSIFSSPALYDVQGDGTAEIFIGGDATENRSIPGDSHNGGYFRSLSYRPGSSQLAQLWQRTGRSGGPPSTEAFQSSAAIGDVDGDGRLEVVTGSGGYYCRYTSVCADSNLVWAFHLDDGSDARDWPKRTTMETTFLASPALGDIDGDGRTDVVVITNAYNQARDDKGPDGAAVDVFFGNGARDTYIARNDIEIMTPAVIADVDGGGGPEIVVADGNMQALNRNLDVVQSGIGPDLAHKNAAAIGDLRTASAPGTPRWALVTAGFAHDPASRAGTVHVYDIPAPASAPWPQFQMDARRLGNDLFTPTAVRPQGPPPAPPPPTPVTGPKPKPKPKPVPTTRPPAPPTTAPPETATTTLPPETTTTTLPPETTTATTVDATTATGVAAGRSDSGGGGSSLGWVLAGALTCASGGALIFGLRRRRTS